MIPIALITGFLGAGKTTYLRHVLKQYEGRKLIYLVNDFAKVDVDGELLRAAGDDVVAIAGGSIFCKCLVTEFIGRLTELAERFGADGSIEGVVIEASGIADPRVIHGMLEETKLDDRFRLSSVVAVVDPGTFYKLIHTLPNIGAQVAAADHIIVNKTDVCDEPRRAELTAQLHELNADAAYCFTEFGNADIDLFSGFAKVDVEGDYAKCRDPNYTSFTVAFDEHTDLAALQQAMERVADDLYRAKGFVPTKDGILYVDWAAGHFRSEPYAAQPDQAEMVFIGRGAAEEQLRSALIQ